MIDYNHNQVSALLDLYKVAPVCENKAGKDYAAVYSPQAQVEHGLLFIDTNGAPVAVDRKLFNAAEALYGIDPFALNATFYTGVDHVTCKTRWELFIDQVIHYASTYGQTAKGQKPLTLIPVQALEIPEISALNIKITVIRLAEDGEIVNLVNETVLTTKSPSPRITNAIKILVNLFDAPVDDIRSFELATIVCDKLDLVPTNPSMLLRYMIYVATGETLVINNKRMIDGIKYGANYQERRTKIFSLLSKANHVGLASIFLRYKNLFLAFKAYPGCAPIINRLRKMANTYHRPLSDVCIQNYINMVLERRQEDAKKVEAKMDNRDIVKVLNAIALRMAVVGTKPGVFNVRNGRAYCKTDAYVELTQEEYDLLNAAEESLFKALTDRIKDTVAGKTFYLPYYVDYAVPVSEKQFVGNFPWGTTFSGEGSAFEPADTTVGVQWVNPSEDEYVDLDLHAFTADNHHFGWNAAEYYSADQRCVYSGDMTNAPAPNGAAEAFWISGIQVPVIFTLNRFSGPSDVDFKLALSSEIVDGPKPNYVMDPNKLLFAPIPLKFENGHGGMTLGYYHNYMFTLYSGNLSNGAVPQGNFAEYLEAIMFQNDTKILLRNLLTYCGATVVAVKEFKEEYESHGRTVIDLSPEALTASTLMDIVDGKLQ